jgi:hypothetical protein
MIPSNARVLYLVIGSLDAEHEADLNAQKQTWLSDLKFGDTFLVLRGSQLSRTKREKNELFLPVEERYENILRKTILGIEWANQHIRYEYVIRTNVSTYFRHSIAHRVLSDRIGLSTPAYGGYIDYANFPTRNDKNCTSYVTGTGIMLNRQAAEVLVKMPINTYSGLPDDVAISLFLESKDIRRTYIARSNFSSTHLLTNAVQIRLKSSHLPGAASLRMFRVHEHEKSKNFMKRVFTWIQLELAEQDYIEISIQEYKRILSAVYISLRNNLSGFRSGK